MKYPIEFKNLSRHARYDGEHQQFGSPVPTRSRSRSGNAAIGFVRSRDNIGPKKLQRKEKFGVEERSSEEIIAKAEQRGARRRQELVAASRPHLTIVEAAEKLGASVSDVKEAIRERRVVWVETTEGETRLPAWQIEGDHIVEGLKEVLDALDDYGWEADLTFFKREHFLLNGDTPAEALLKGKVEKVKRCAATQWKQGGT